MTGIPAATISRIENNKMAPTFPVLIKLMVGLRMAWRDILGPPEEDSPELQIDISLPGDAAETNVPGTASYSALHAGTPLSRHMYVANLEVEFSSVEECGGLRGHQGVECCYVLSGVLMLHFEGLPPQELPQGASAQFSSKIPHCYVAKPGQSANVLIVVATDAWAAQPDLQGAFEDRFNAVDHGND